MKKSYIIYPFILLNMTCQQQNVHDLPTIIIDTYGKEIPDEPKISAYMGIIDPTDNGYNYSDSSYSYKGDIGIEIRGHSSQGFPKKQYGLETRNSNGDNLSVSLFGMPEQKDWILYAPYSDKSLMRNVIAYDIYRSLGYYAPRTKFCQVVLNGDYIGIYVFMEKIKKDENRVPIDNPGPDNISGGYLLEFETWLKLDTTDNYFESEITRRHESAYVIQFPKDDDITNDQIAWIENYINRFESTLYSDLLYNDYNKYIDFPSWVDYILINEALKNNDVFHSSTYLHKKKDGKLFAGPVWDFNLAMGNVNWGDSYLTEGWLMEKRYLVSRLYQDSIFVNEFNKRWNSLRKDLLATHTIKSLINDYKNLLDKAQKNNYVRWPILGKYIWPNRYVGYSYEDEINYLEHWIQARFSWIDSQFSDIPYSGELQITGDVYKLFHNSTQEYSGSLKGGKKDKLWIEFYEINPKNFYDIPNKDGREGEFKKYWYKPQKKKEGYYKDGELISEKCWDVDGNEMNCNDLEF